MSRSDSPPTELPPPPREVHGGAGCAIWGLRLFILPHTIAGVFLLGQFFLALGVALFGTDLSATVTRAYTKPASKGGTIYYLEYRYTAGGQTYNASDSVGDRTYTEASRPGELEGGAGTLRIRYFALGPYQHHLITQHNSLWGQVGGNLFIALFWNGILSVFLYKLWIEPIRTRLLVRHGSVARGTIVSTRESRGKGTTYYATFRFREPATGQEITRETELAGWADHTMAQPGRTVTVLYNPNHPRRALLYEFSGYRVSGAWPQLWG